MVSINSKSISPYRKLDLFIGYSCNNNCRFCYVANRRKHGDNDSEIIKNKLQTGIAEGCDQVHFVGGEPTIRKDIIELVRFANEIGFKSVVITSNGRMFVYKKFTTELLKLDVTNLILSIHGHNAMIHDSLTQVDGSFDQLMKGIDNIHEIRDKVKSNVLVESNVVIVNKNYKYLPKIAQVIINKKLEAAEMNMVHPQGYASQNFEEIVPWFSDVAPFAKKAIQMGIDNGTSIVVRYVPFCFMKGYERYNSEMFEADSISQYAPEFKVEDGVKAKKENANLKAPQCVECRFDPICFGIHRQLERELPNLIPVVGTKIKSKQELLDMF